MIDSTSPYALTGAVLAWERNAVETAIHHMCDNSGNFYVNDKPADAVVGRQLFGGTRASGTNDKAGSKLKLMRRISPRTISENMIPPTDYRYPFMETE